MAESAGRPCPTCQRPWSAEDFYGSATECRPCKRERSRQNRLVAARKIALAERFVDVLVNMAATNRGPEGDCAASGPSIGPREVLS